MRARASEVGRYSIIASSAIFALTIIAIGSMGLVDGSFGPIWLPVPEKLVGRDVLAYLCALIALSTGVGLLTKRMAGTAALALLLYLVVWTVAFKVPFIVRAPLTEVNYESCGENLVLIVAAWSLYVRAAANTNALARPAALKVAHALYGLALLAFGLSHFFYMQLTAPLVPKWLPAPESWAYLTGAIYAVTGILITTGFYARIAAYVVAFQITLITGLVWAAPALSGALGGPTLGEAVISWALTAGAWVIVASFELSGTSQPAAASAGMAEIAAAS